MSDIRMARDSAANWIGIGVFATLAVFIRLVPYYFPLDESVRWVWNFSAVGALGLFAGARLGSWAAYFVPVGVMLVSDLLLIQPLANLGGAFTWLTPVVYGCLVLNVFLGRCLQETTSPLWAVPGAIATASVFFVVTNFSCWLGGDGPLYQKSFAGLIECYVAALPFVKGTLIGDLSYSLLFFGLYAAVHFVTQRQKVSQPA